MIVWADDIMLMISCCYNVIERFISEAWKWWRSKYWVGGSILGYDFESKSILGGQIMDTALQTDLGIFILRRVWSASASRAGNEDCTIGPY